MSDMAETNIADDLPPGAMITSRIEIVTWIDPEDNNDNYIVGTKTNGGNGNLVPLITALGMLEIAKNSVAVLAEEDDEDDNN